jgi:hypothetical protein
MSKRFRWNMKRLEEFENLKRGCVVLVFKAGWDFGF